MKYASRTLALISGGLILASWTSATAADANAELALTQFVDVVVEQNPQVQAAQAALDATIARQDAAERPLYNPSLTLSAENAGAEQTRTIGVSQTIDWGGKRHAKTSIAEAKRLRSRAQYIATRWAVISELLRGLAQYQTGVEQKALADQRVQLMGEFTDLAERRFEAGDLNQIELDLARIAANDARIQRATSAAALAEARQSVRNLTPRSPADEWPALSAELPALAETIDPDALLAILPAVQAAQLQIESASAVVDLRQREKRPDPTFSIEGGTLDNDSLIGINVSIPLHVRNSYSHEIIAALADRSEARQLANDVAQRAYARVLSAADRYRAVRGAWYDWSETGNESLTRQGTQINRMWRAGEISTTDYLVQLRQILDVQQNALDLRHAFWRAWIEWLDASGQVDTWLNLKATN